MKMKPGLFGALAPALLATVLAGSFGQAADLKSYDSSKPSFWQHPPADWFLGDETAAQKGLARLIHRSDAHRSA